MRIAVVQAAGRPGDSSANLATVEAAATEAARTGAQLAVFPEAFVSGYNIGRDRLLELASTAEPLQQIARRAGIALVCGYPESDLFNAAALVDAGGELKTRYRKTHLFGDVDRAAFTPGDVLNAPVQLDDLRIGVLVCFDIEFPEPARALADEGAQLLAVPTSLMAPYDAVARYMVPSRAAENQIFVAYANRVGREGDLEYIGQSVIAGPDGPIAVAGTHEETIIYADLDPATLAEARARYSYLDERRPELY